MRHDIQTAGGTYFDLVQPHRSVMDIEAIAHALSQICRFTGHTRTHYSVAQHSVLVSYVVEDEHAFAGLMHDAHEAYVNDLASPLKRLCLDYKRVEHNVQDAVLKHFGLWGADVRQATKHADRVLLVTEQRDLMPAKAGGDWSAVEGVEPLPWTIEPLPAPMAKALFLRRYRQLQALREAH